MRRKGKATKHISKSNTQVAWKWKEPSSRLDRVTPEKYQYLPEFNLESSGSSLEFGSAPLYYSLSPAKMSDSSTSKGTPLIPKAQLQPTVARNKAPAHTDGLDRTDEHPPCFGTPHGHRANAPPLHAEEHQTGANRGAGTIGQELQQLGIPQPNFEDETTGNPPPPPQQPHPPPQPYYPPQQQPYPYPVQPYNQYQQQYPPQPQYQPPNYPQPPYNPYNQYPPQYQNYQPYYPPPPQPIPQNQYNMRPNPVYEPNQPQPQPPIHPRPPVAQYRNQPQEEQTILDEICNPFKFESPERGFISASVMQLQQGG